MRGKENGIQQEGNLEWPNGSNILNSDENIEMPRELQSLHSLLVNTELELGSLTKQSKCCFQMSRV